MVEDLKLVVGLLRVEVHLPQALSLKDKRSVLKSMKDQLRGRFNIAIAELDPNEKWQRAALGITTVGNDRRYVEGCLSAVADAIRRNPSLAVIRLEQEWF